MIQTGFNTIIYFKHFKATFKRELRLSYQQEDSETRFTGTKITSLNYANWIPILKRIKELFLT